MTLEIKKNKEQIIFRVGSITKSSYMIPFTLNGIILTQKVIMKRKTHGRLESDKANFTQPQLNDIIVFAVGGLNDFSPPHLVRIRKG